MPNMKGGQLIAEYLVQEKMPYVFGICGHGNVGMLDALYDVKDRIKLVSPRHEQCAGHMADAYYRVRHRPVATLTSTGPGSANLVMSLATALSDSSAFTPARRSRSSPSTTRRISRRCCARSLNGHSSPPVSTCCRSRCGRRWTRWSPAGRAR